LLKSSHPTEHAAQSGFDSCGELVMGRARGDAINKNALLVPVGESEIIGETAIGCEFPGTNAEQPKFLANRPSTAGILWETWCNNLKNTEQNEQLKKLPSARAIMCKVLKRLML
jgi:hypothetical protein